MNMIVQQNKQPEFNEKYKHQVVCITLPSGCRKTAVMLWEENCIDSRKFYVSGTEEYTEPQLSSWSVNGCSENRQAIDTCWLPDQYAIQWSWGGNGDLSSYNALTGETTYYGKTQYNGSTVGGYALAFKNDAIDPTLFFQVGGNLYKASPDDPINTFTLVGSTAAFTGSGPGATSSYPCFDFIDGNLLIGDGNRAWSLNETTGESEFVGTLIDIRDGANLSVSPGDWFSDPNGEWFMMARDNRGASLLDQDGNPYCTGTAVWKVDKVTLEATLISKTCSPVSGTGASWLSASQYLLSVGAGQVYGWNRYTEEWGVVYDVDDNDQGANVTINDLAPQWITPDPIRVTGWVDTGCDPDTCEPKLFTIVQNEDSTLRCEEFIPTTPGKFQCEKDPNPFVSDPFDDSGSSSGGSSGCDHCPDEKWHKGCSDEGYTWWRAFYPAGETSPAYQYIYGSSDGPTGTAPSGFSQIPCEDQPTSTNNINEICDDDTGNSLFREELPDGSIRFFDETGTVTEPTNWSPGSCESTDPNIETQSDTVCVSDVVYIRKQTDVYTPDGSGLPQLTSRQVVFFNSTGTLYDSGVVPVTSTWPPVGEPSYTLGECPDNCKATWLEDRCEIDDEKLLLIDSNGAFAEYSFLDGSVTNINTISVPSAGGSADPDNYVLYSYVSPDQLYVTDVNTKQVVNQITLTSNDGSPLSFSAAAFDIQDGFLYSHNNSNIYRTDVNTGEISLVSPISGVSGSGTSMAIDANGRMIIMGSSGRVYEINRTTGAGTLIHTSTYNVGNGSTFNADTVTPMLYITSGNNTVAVDLASGDEELIIDSWPPGANSLAYYRTKAAAPACFMREYCKALDGSINVIGDYFLDGSPRIISGAVVCCAETISGGSNSSSTYGGPSAQDIADAIVITERNSKQGRVAKFTGNSVQQLSVSAGQRGNLVAISDTGTGIVYFTTDGTTPTNSAGSNRGEMSGQYLAVSLQNIDLSLLRFDGSSASSDYTVYYEVYV